MGESEWKKAGRGQLAFLHTPHVKAGLQSIPCKQKNPPLCCLHRLSDRDLPACCSFTGTRLPLQVKSTNICCAVALCQILCWANWVNIAESSFLERTDNILGEATYPIKITGYKLASGRQVYAFQESTIGGQWQQRPPVAVSHPRTLFGALSNREAGQAQRHIPQGSPVMAQ